MWLRSWHTSAAPVISASPLPSASAVVAASEIFAGEVKIAPFGGDVRERGRGLVRRGVNAPKRQARSVTVFAIDDMPAVSTMKSM
jgi:hypothetical protein